MTLRLRGGPAKSSQDGLAKDHCWTRVGDGGWKGPTFSGVSLWRNSVYSHENNTHKITHLHTSSLTGGTMVDKSGVLNRAGSTGVRPDTQEEGIIWRNSVYSLENNLHKEYHWYTLTLLLKIAEPDEDMVLRTTGGLIWRNENNSHI